MIPPQAQAVASEPLVWDWALEHADRKKEAKAAAETTNVVGQRIEEDPEAEAAAERDEVGRSVEVAA